MLRSEAETAATGAALTRRHLHLRPTKLCYSLWLVSAAVWVGAVNYQVNVAYAVCFWLLALSGVAALQTCRQLLGLRVHLDFQGEVFAGQHADIVFTAEGAGRRLFWWRGEAGGRERGDWQRAEHAERHRGVWRLPVHKRGRFPAPLHLRLGSSAPFGLFYAECRVAWQCDAVAYPAPVAHREHGGSPRPDTDATSQQTAAGGDDPAYLKAHQAGASLQHIAWKVYAKRGELLDKVFDEPPVSADKTVLSYRDYPPGTSADRLAGLLAHRVLRAESGGLPYTLELPQQRVPPQNGQREKCLYALALL